MKYLITESQYEILIENQKYVDSLLDKISEEGYQSLSVLNIKEILMSLFTLLINTMKGKVK